MEHTQIVACPTQGILSLSQFLPYINLVALSSQITLTFADERRCN